MTPYASRYDHLLQSCRRINAYKVEIILYVKPQIYFTKHSKTTSFLGDTSDLPF